MPTVDDLFKPTLRVIIARAATDAVLLKSASMFETAFGLEAATGAYLADVAPNNSVDFRMFSETPPEGIGLDGALHTLVVALVDRDLTEPWLGWLDDAAAHARASNGRHKVIAFAADESTQTALGERGSELSRTQLNLASRFGERALRPAILGLIAINEARRLIADACKPALGTHLRLFISHAKADGLPLALAIKNQIPMIPHLAKFYDDSELLLSGDWAYDLEKSVGQSTVMIVRTDRFDGRSACRNEAQWASRYACPTLVVDARQSLLVEESYLGIGDVPTVKVPDGNVYRALHAALWVGLRGLCVARAVHGLQLAGALEDATVRVLHRSPTFGAIRRLCGDMEREGVIGTPLLIHPGPDLDGDAGEPFRIFAETHLPGVRLITVERLLTEVGLS